VASFEAPGVESKWCDGERVSGNWGTSGFWEVGRLCGFAHTSVREAIERAREERDEGH